MKPIPITEDKRAQIEEALASAQQRARVNRYDADEVFAMARQAEMELERLRIPKDKRPGAAYVEHESGPAANSYGYRQGATRVRLVRNTRGWHLAEAVRIALWPKQKGAAGVKLTPAQRDLALEKFQETLARKTMSAAEMAGDWEVPHDDGEIDAPLPPIADIGGPSAWL